MSKVIDGGCINSDLILNLRKNTIRFKAGSELSSSVNKMDVDVFEDRDEKFETLVVSISLGQQQCKKEI
ncbi:MAG: hypothetical protein K9G36_10585 [Crocinitomicaceae bacterium]|nr:hypothetical protein [Crocinitomicaceae bacterium]